MFLKSHYFWRTYLGYVVVALIGTTLFAASLIKKTEQQVQESLSVLIQLSCLYYIVILQINVNLF